MVLNPIYPTLLQAKIDLFSGQPAFPAPVSTSVDLFGASSGLLSSEPKNASTFDPFAVSDPGMHVETMSAASGPAHTINFDPFASIQLNLKESDVSGDLASHIESAKTEAQQNTSNNGLNSIEQTSVSSSKPAPKKDSFQVKSGIWADSLSRGLIDLNITARKYSVLI